MFNQRSFHKWLFSVLILLLLSACSGGGGSSNDFASVGTVTQGIAVDPYIVGAVFQEIDPDTGAVLQESSPSDESGLFSFENSLTPGSIVEMVPNTGLHGGAPYHGMLRRIVEADDDSPVVVTPLTTLLANGLTESELIAVFNDAGLTGLTTSDLYADPMAGLADMLTGVTDQDLVLLQASMAASAYMEVTGNFQAGMDELHDADHFQIFSNMVAAMDNLLNSQEFSAVADALASDPDITSAPILEDYILAAVAQQQTIVALAQENMANNGFFNPAMVEQAVLDAMGNSLAMVKASYSLRVPLAVSYDGATLYHDNCSACHGILALSDLPGRTAADIQTAIDQNFGGMGGLNNLTMGEITALAEVLPLPQAPAPVSPAPAPVPDPTVPLDGAALYTNNCSLCHGQPEATDIVDRSATGIQAAMDTIGMMASLGTLTQEEIAAIADVLPQYTAPVSGPDYSNCTVCHGQPPAGSSYPDTAGAHAVHTALASVGGDCTICHLGAAHNSQVDLGFPVTFDAKSGSATDNLDGTCSTVICHGGQTTPDWWSGSIAVDTQCTSCHSSGSSQYNSYASGRHSKHVGGEGFSCTVCHNTGALINGHFSNLESIDFELSPAATIGGGSTRVGSYSNGTCSSIECHGSKSW